MPPGGARKRGLCRGSIKPLFVIHEAARRLLLGNVGEQGQDGQGDENDPATLPTRSPAPCPGHLAGASAPRNRHPPGITRTPGPAPPPSPPATAHPRHAS